MSGIGLASGLGFKMNQDSVYDLFGHLDARWEELHLEEIKISRNQDIKVGGAPP